MIGSSMRLWRILSFSLCVTTTLFPKCQSFKLANNEADSKSIAKNEDISRISIEHGAFKRSLADTELGSICEIGDDVTFDCWNKHCSSLGDKDKSFTIKFKTLFSVAPKVMVGLNFLDVNHNFNTRINAAAKEVTATKFRLNIKAWADTYIHMAKVNWIACGPAHASSRN